MKKHNGTIRRSDNDKEIGMKTLLTASALLCLSYGAYGEQEHYSKDMTIQETDILSESQEDEARSPPNTQPDGDQADDGSFHDFLPDDNQPGENQPGENQPDGESPSEGWQGERQDQEGNQSATDEPNSIDFEDSSEEENLNSASPADSNSNLPEEIGEEIITQESTSNSYSESQIPTKTISKGSTNNDLGRDIQIALNASGETLELDGIIGGKTKAAIRRFQKKHSLTPTGQVDTLTLKKLGLN